MLHEVRCHVTWSSVVVVGGWEGEGEGERGGGGGDLVPSRMS
jgi:hypothetical protein